MSITIEIIIDTVMSRKERAGASRGRRMHARNQHLRNHRGFSVAFSNEFSVAFSNGISFASGMFQRIINYPSGLSLELSNGCSGLHFPMEFDFCDVLCVICCHDTHTHTHTHTCTNPSS